MSEIDSDGSTSDSTDEELLLYVSSSDDSFLFEEDSPITIKKWEDVLELLKNKNVAEK